MVRFAAAAREAGGRREGQAACDVGWRRAPKMG